MWQHKDYGRIVLSYGQMLADSRQSGPFTNRVVDLTSPVRAPAAPGQEQHKFDYKQEEEVEFPFVLSQDIGVSFAIRRTPGDFELLESPTTPGAISAEKLDVDLLPSKISRESLNEEQREAANMAIYGRGNIFLTGPAGTGKSFLLRYIIQELKARRKGDVFVTATTGVAAENIKGTTLHSFAGIGLGQESADVLLTRIKSKKAASERWSKVRYLIVDEVSMLHVDLFEKLEEIARRIKNISKNEKKKSKVEDEKPFGGIKLILCGDFFQLPPVDRKRSGNKYAFQSNIWNDFCAIRTVSLREVHRQTDGIFVNMLNEIRIGKFSDHTRAQLDACHVNVKPVPKDGILPTKLYCLNRNVDAENMNHLNQLAPPDFTYIGRDKWVPRRAQSTDDYNLEEQYDTYADDDGDMNSNGKIAMIAELDRKSPISIRLRVGAQVMYTRNDPALGLVNGSRGVVVMLDDNIPTVKFDNGSVLPLKFAKQGQSCAEGKIIRTYMPLKLAWALTVHKSQGMTLTRVELQLDNAFECGQVYVALSRVKSLPGLFIRGGRITPDLVRADEAVLEAFGPTQERVSHQATMKSYFSEVSAAAKRKRPDQQVEQDVSRVRSSSSSDSESSDAPGIVRQNCNQDIFNRQRNHLQDSRRKNQAQASSNIIDPSFCNGDRMSALWKGADVIDLVSPVKCRRPAQTAVLQLGTETRSNGLVLDNYDNHELQDDFLQPCENAWVFKATQPLPAPTSEMSQQEGPFSATFCQTRIYAYKTATSRPVSSCSSSCSAVSISSAGGANAYWRAKSLSTSTQRSGLESDLTPQPAVPLPTHSIVNAAPVLVPPVSTLAPAPEAATPCNKVSLYFDGGSLGNPGVSGAGYVLYPDQPQPPHVVPTIPLAQAAVRMSGICTNNQAEYTGLIHGLQAATARDIRQIDVYGDSELVIKQMKGEYKVKNVVLQGMNRKAQLLARRFSRITFNWVERNKNKPADALSNRAMHQPASAEEHADWVGK